MVPTRKRNKVTGIALSQDARKSIAVSIFQARERDRIGWTYSGDYAPKLRAVALRARSLLFSKKIVRILDAGAYSGKYWDEFFNLFPDLHGRVKVICLNPSRHGFEAQSAELMVGTILTLGKKRMTELFARAGGKFDLIVSMHGEYANTPEKEAFKLKAKKFLRNPTKIDLALITERDIFT